MKRLWGIVVALAIACADNNFQAPTTNVVDACVQDIQYSLDASAYGLRERIIGMSLNTFKTTLTYANDTLGSFVHSGTVYAELEYTTSATDTVTISVFPDRNMRGFFVRQGTLHWYYTTGYTLLADTAVVTHIADRGYAVRPDSSVWSYGPDLDSVVGRLYIRWGDCS